MLQSCKEKKKKKRKLYNSKLGLVLKPPSLYSQNASFIFYSSFYITCYKLS